ncbi:MAG: nucleotide exchange factor GrpE [Ginsengibacter sp.]
MTTNHNDMQENELENLQDNDLNDSIEQQHASIDNVNDDSLKNEEENNDNVELQKLKQELEEQKDKYIRLFAEFDNYKRRTSKEAIETRQTAGKEIIISLLDVLDDMDRAEKQMAESDEEKTLKEGILLVFDKFRKILQARGLRSLDTLHTEFDVEKDEAVSEIHVEDKKLKGKVVAELQKGYYLNDKLIRFAKVVVGK